MVESRSLVVGILYPPTWYGPEDGFRNEVQALEELDPSVQVVVATYEDPHEVRTARGVEAAAPRVFQTGPLTPETLDALSRVHVALAIDLPVGVTTLAPNLKWVQAVGAGTSHLQNAGLADAGIRLTSNGGSNSIGIAEFAFGRLLEAAKRFPELADAQSEQRWDPLYGAQVSGQTLGLIGYGPINQAVAARASAFGMRVLVMRRSVAVTPEPPVEAFYAPHDLHEMLEQCDAVIAAVPETPETIGMFDAHAFAAMRPGAFFANVGRGTLVDQVALASALRRGQVGAAALDVTTVEPLPPGDPLWDAPNLRISAHCSTSPSAMFPTLHRLFRDNLRRFIDGEPLHNQVEVGRGY